MERELFEQLVGRGLELIPERFRKLMSNVTIVVEEYPTIEQIKKAHIGKHSVLLGLYEGIPKTQRDTGYANVLPDKITIFQKAIENSSIDPKEIEKIVANTVWHEIAHHFGLNEEEIRNNKRNVQI
jgi:predicted Zn-dependent protease with MMP-like domain